MLISRLIASTFTNHHQISGISLILMHWLQGNYTFSEIILSNDFRYWRGAEYMTLNYARLACGLFWTEGYQDPADLRKTLVQFSHVQLFVTPWTEACQAFLSITNSRNLLKFMSIESVMASNHLILRDHLLLLPSIFPSIRVFSS